MNAIPVFLLLATAGLSAAAEPAFSLKGNVIFSEDFSSPTLAKGWVGQPGTWEIVDGAAKISERPEDKHPAVRRHGLKYHDAIFEFSFQLNGAKMIALSINNRGGHVCRLSISPTVMVLQTDTPNAKSGLKPERLAVRKVAVEPGKWHTVVVEVKGPRMTAQLDGGRIISGESARVDVDKTDLGFPVAGVFALLDKVRVYEVK